MKSDRISDLDACSSAPAMALDRRSMLGTLLAAAVAAGLPIPAALAQAIPELKGKRITYASWGGAYQESQKKAYCDPFASLHGVTIDQDGPPNAAKFRLMVKSGQITWDVCDIGGSLMAAGVKEGLFEKLDFSKIDRSGVDPRYVNDYGVGNLVFSFNLAYNTEAFKGKEPPKTWADMWDLKKFPGKRLLTAAPTSTLEAVLLADGVPADKLYPLDVDRALKKLDLIKDHVLWWESHSQSQQLLGSGAASFGFINNGRIYDSVEKGAPLAILWDKALLNVDYIVIPKGSTNNAAAHALIDFIARPDTQAALANILPFSPTCPSAFAKIDEKMAPWLATNPKYADTAVLVNNDYWRDNLAKVTQRWDQWRLS